MSHLETNHSLISYPATLRENGWTDLHEIFREGVEWPWPGSILGQFGKRVGGSKVNWRLLSKNRIIAVILFFCTSLISLQKFSHCSVMHRGHSYLVWLWSSCSPVLPPSDWECNEIAVFGLWLRGSTGAGFVVPRTTACCYFYQWSWHCCLDWSLAVTLCSIVKFSIIYKILLG